MNEAYYRGTDFRVTGVTTMETGLVYLRPKRVVFYRAHGPFRESGPKAWQQLLAVVDRLGFRDEVIIGYGLARDDAAQVAKRTPRYEACIELPPSVDMALVKELQFQELPGGAYARLRYVGPVDGIGEASRKFRETWLGDHGLRADRSRPLVEIYLDDPKNVAPEKLRIDLCMPITVESMSNAA